MNYKIIATVLGAAALIIPAGLALANDGVRANLGTSVNAINEHAQTGLNLGLHGDSDVNENNVNENEDSATSADIEVGEHGNATSTVRNHEKQGDLERDIHATTTASTTKPHEGLGKGGVVGFFKWILGLPDTTTVGQIRADLTATTTASTSLSSSQGLGFWARILGFLHLGGN